MINLLGRLRLLLHQLEPPGRTNAGRGVLQQLQLSVAGHVLANEPRDEDLWTILPLHHHFLRRHHLVALQTIQQCHTHDRTPNSCLVGERCECRALHFDIDDTWNGRHDYIDLTLGIPPFSDSPKSANLLRYSIFSASP